MRSGKLRDERKFRATQASITCSIHVTTFRVAKTNPAIDYPWKRLSFDNFKDIIHRFLGFCFHLSSAPAQECRFLDFYLLSIETQTPFLETFFLRCVSLFFRDSSAEIQNWWSNLMSGRQRDQKLINESLRNGFDVFTHHWRNQKTIFHSACGFRLVQRLLRRHLSSFA